MTLDLSAPGRFHIVGLGGAAMSAIAAVLVSMGHEVSGSDLNDSPALERLRALGVRVFVGHRAAQVGDPQFVAVSTAVPAHNPEVVQAKEAGVPVLSRAEILVAIAATRRVVAVGGTHGKTTTSSMLARVLVAAGWQPSFVIGGDVQDFGTGAAWDRGEWLVLEADESDGTFLELPAEAVVVTSVEPDHLDHYGTCAALVAAFARFLGQAPGPRVVCADFPAALELATAHGALTYGTSDRADYRIVDVRAERAQTSFTVVRPGETVGHLTVPQPGLYNARNATAAAVTALALGVPFAVSASALARFGGVARRFQFRGERHGITYIDDYAHLPGEVREVLDAARAGGWRRIVCVFQPHRYSRTQALARDFAGAFDGVDLLVVTDVYPAGEPARPGVSGKLVIDAVLEAEPRARVAYFPDRGDLVAYLRRVLRPGDLCLTLGAGDLTLVPDQLLVPTLGPV